MRRLITLLLACSIVAGCGGSDDITTTNAAEQQTTATTAVPSTTVPEPTTTAPVTTTTGSPPTTTTVPKTSTNETTTDPGPAVDRYVVGSEPGVFPRPDTTTGPLPGSEGASGSGCAPASTSLHEGIWFGFVTAKSDTSITFDLACFFFGTIAVAEAANDGVVDEDEIYIRNANPAMRTITVDPSVLVYEHFEDLTDTIEVPFNPVLFAHWPEDPSFPNPCPSESCGVWLFVNDGVVTEMMEQIVVP